MAVYRRLSVSIVSLKLSFFIVKSLLVLLTCQYRRYGIHKESRTDASTENNRSSRFQACAVSWMCFTRDQEVQVAHEQDEDQKGQPRGVFVFLRVKKMGMDKWTSEGSVEMEKMSLPS